MMVNDSVTMACIHYTMFGWNFLLRKATSAKAIAVMIFFPDIINLGKILPRKSFLETNKR